MENDTKNSDILYNASTLALNDSYLNDLIKDWDKEKNDYIKNEMFQEIVNYTHEIMRIKRL